MTDNLHHHDEAFDAYHDYQETEGKFLFFDKDDAFDKDEGFEEEVFDEDECFEEEWDDAWNEVELDMYNDYYNEDLDMDQQSQDYWDNI